MVSTGPRPHGLPGVLRGSGPGRGEGGFAMAVLLVSLSLLGLLMSMALPVWSQQARRVREAELIFRGEQYARAIALYQRRQPGAFPSDVDTLVEERYLRRKYGDPMTGGGDFRILRQSERPAPGLGGGAGGTASDGQTDSAADRPGVSSNRSRGRDRDDGGSGPEGGIIGVVSRSTEASLRTYNGRRRYDQWEFTYESAATGGDAGDPTPRSGGPGLGDRLEGAGSTLRGSGSPRGEPLGPGR